MGFFKKLFGIESTDKTPQREIPKQDILKQIEN